jgi:cell pole-organizing protein PopZ
MTSSTTSQSRLSEATAAEQRAHEPSMEEILASIRRIIADDQMLPISRPAAAAPEPAPVEIVERAPEPAIAPPVEAPRAERIARPVEPEPARRVEAPVVRPLPVEPPAARAPIVEPAPRVEPAARAEPPRPAAPRREVPAFRAPEPAAIEERPLLSAENGNSVSSAFNALATTMVLQNQGMIEEATREMLRPLLKQWLDDNLPIMVERLVRIEIERVARGGR